jgi:predicted nucleotidyltransferase
MGEVVLPLILPVGTQVVIAAEVPGADGAGVYPAGSVGVIVKAPVDHEHSYRVRFPDGGEAALRRHHLAVRKQVQGQGLHQAITEEAEANLYEHIIYRCVVGSRAYGLDGPDSDTDRRGIYLPPAAMQWSLYGVPEQLERDETQECYWELQRFLVLALKANPNVLECLYTPLVETVQPLAEELLSIRASFLSKLIYQTYNGYVMSQFRKLEQDLRARGAIKWKHAMHLIRLLLSGVIALNEGLVPVRVEAHREQLLAIRRGEVPWDEVNAWRLNLHKTFDAAFAETRLPERPDYERVNAFLLKARRSMAEKEGEARGN